MSTGRRRRVLPLFLLLVVLGSGSLAGGEGLQPSEGRSPIIRQDLLLFLSDLLLELPQIHPVSPKICCSGCYSWPMEASPACLCSSNASMTSSPPCGPTFKATGSTSSHYSWQMGSVSRFYFGRSSFGSINLQRLQNRAPSQDLRLHFLIFRSATDTTKIPATSGKVSTFIWDVQKEGIILLPRKDGGGFEVTVQADANQCISVAFRSNLGGFIKMNLIVGKADLRLFKKIDGFFSSFIRTCFLIPLDESGEAQNKATAQPIVVNLRVRRLFKASMRS